MSNTPKGKGDMSSKALREQEVRIRQNERQLAGIFASAAEVKEPRPAIAILHGFTSHKNEDPLMGRNEGLCQHTARRLSEFGYVVLRFDFSGLRESDGNFKDISFSQLVSDTLVSLDFLAK